MVRPTGQPRHERIGLSQNVKDKRRLRRPLHPLVMADSLKNGITSWRTTDGTAKT
jgi:hypothetical protein